MAATMTKVTSLGSQYSASNTPSAPNPTPATETLDNYFADSPPMTDFAAVTKALVPIQETLNESAEEAMYPSPPINTPEVLSPAPSVYRYQNRGRGFSVISDRLAQVKVDNRKFPRRDIDLVSSSRSAEVSVAGDDEYEVASIDEVLSDGGRDKRGPGQGNSPTVNPRIAEYLAFTSKDLPTEAPASCFVGTPIELTSSSTKTAIDNESVNSRNSIRSEGDGVAEKSNWAEEVDESLDRACMRLEQLARDEYVRDSTKSFEQYYIDRLRRMLGSNKRVVPVEVEKKSNGQQK